MGSSVPKLETCIKMKLIIEFIGGAIGPIGNGHFGHLHDEVKLFVLLIVLVTFILVVLVTVVAVSVILVMEILVLLVTVVSVILVMVYETILEA